MRTGADYRNSLRDGRRVFILGEGQVDDVTTHPATRAMVEQYVGWYDRHADPAWKDTLFRPDGTPVDYLVPKTSDDLVRMPSNRIRAAIFGSSASSGWPTRSAPVSAAILA